MRIPDFRPTDTPNLDDQKAVLRRAVLARRAEVSPDAATQAAEVLAQHLPRHPLLDDLDPGPVLVPTRHRTELDTAPLSRALEDAGWTLVRPRTRGDDLEPVPWARDGTLVPGRWGVPEPPPHAPAMAPEQLVAVVVPTVAFDSTGARLGMGSGVFDRFLPRTRKASVPPPVIGIGYRFQFVDAVPTAEHDARLDGLQVEDRAVVCRPT